MDDQNFNHNRPFRQSTLAELRWVAILGQLSAVAVAYFGLRLEFDVLAILIVIGLWVLANLVQQTIFANQLRLDARSSFWVLLIDLLELSIVLDLSGGLNNPFIVLLIVPAILAATNLEKRAYISMIIVTILALIFLEWHSEPVRFQGAPIELPRILNTGVFVAMVVLLLFLSLFARRISRENLNMANALAASELALQREHRLSSLGALVAAYAHELGTPLATIRLTASDLLSANLDDQSKEDVEVILGEAKRSASILQSMSAQDDALNENNEYIDRLTLRHLIEEAAAPHLKRGKNVEMIDTNDAIWMRRSEAIIQGVRNLIQNAVDFADENVIIELSQNEHEVRLRISDDGQGFPPDMISKLGEPYLKLSNSESRQNYDGMGLGIFIAKTLLERSGAKLQFANRVRPNGAGATVLITWPKDALMIDDEAKAEKGAPHD